MLDSLFARASLKTKLTSVTAVIVLGSCASLSWLFIDREIASMEETLWENGHLVARNVAEHSTNSVIAGDQERLSRLIEGTLTSARVVYALIISGSGQVLQADGTGAWREILADPVRAGTLVSLTPQLSPPQDASTFITPSDRIIELKNGEMVISDPDTYSRKYWRGLLTGSSHPAVFHIVEPIQKPLVSSNIDPALSLTFSESIDTGSTARPFERPYYGYVLLGLSSVRDHMALRKISLQIVLITGIVIVLSLVAIIYLTKQMTTPLQTLTALAAREAHGDLTASAAPGLQDEIGRLALAFNQMMTALKAREEDLLELNRTLESRIETRTKELQDANRELTRVSQLKTALVSNASHELRTPLTSIKVHVKNLLDGIGGTPNSSQCQTLTRVYDNVDRLGTLINNLLDLSRLQAGGVKRHWEDVSVRCLVQETVENLHHLAQSKHLRLIASSQHDLPAIEGDHDQLLRVLTNIVDNSIKFTPQGGHIRIQARRNPADHVTITIEDSGCGVPPEDMDKVFLPFFRSESISAQTRGSGLGLSIAKEIVDLHQGTILIENLPGGGCRTVVRLPVIHRHTIVS